MFSIIEPGRRRLAAPSLLAAGILLPAFLVSGASAGPSVAILAPRDGAALPPGNAILIGKGASTEVSRVEVEVNGKARTAVAGPHGVFRAQIPIAQGRNVIRVTAGGGFAAVTVTGAAGGGYRYHPAVEKCGGCHADGRGFTVAGPRDAVCYRCHDRKDGGRTVHGPLGSGDCTSCHDPHGSGNAPLLAAATETLCRSCHDQKGSEKHMSAARGKACTSCHDPHSANGAFLQK